jgi:hypothetical protein
MAVPASDAPTRNPTQSARSVSTVRLLDHAQLCCGFDCRFGSLTEGRGDADLCDEDERKRAASGRQWSQPRHCLFSILN